MPNFWFRWSMILSRIKFVNIPGSCMVLNMFWNLIGKGDAYQVLSEVEQTLSIVLNEIVLLLQNLLVLINCYSCLLVLSSVNSER